MKVLISLEGASPQTDIVRNLTPLEFRDLLSKPAWVPVNYLGWYYDNPPIWDGESWNVNPKYDAWGKVNDLHPKSLFSFPIPEGMTYENEPIKFEIEI